MSQKLTSQNIHICSMSDTLTTKTTQKLLHYSSPILYKAKQIT